MDGYAWHKTGFVSKGGCRVHDIWFLDEQVGWAIDDDYVYRTFDGGNTWSEPFKIPGGQARCITFIRDQNKPWDKMEGFIGTLNPNAQIIYTSDGGESWWRWQTDRPKSPIGLCGVCSVSEEVKEGGAAIHHVIGVGSNRPQGKPGLLKWNSQARKWKLVEMGHLATLLVDVHFKDPRRGWVAGGLYRPETATRDKVRSLILYTDDGGKSWTEQYWGHVAGEWGWKIQFVTEEIGFVSLENQEEGAILKTSNGGKSWERLVVNDPDQKLVQGVGFLNERTGWVSGWTRKGANAPGNSSGTSNGGASWRSTNHIGTLINRFLFLNRDDPSNIVAYSCGQSVFKYTKDKPVTSNSKAEEGIFSVRDSRLYIEEGWQLQELSISNRFGELICEINLGEFSQKDVCGEQFLANLFKVCDEPILALQGLFLKSEGDQDVVEREWITYAAKEYA